VVSFSFAKLITNSVRLKSVRALNVIEKNDPEFASKVVESTYGIIQSVLCVLSDNTCDDERQTDRVA
jgi:hypothetical protein